MTRLSTLLIVGFWTTSAFANVYSTSDLDCTNGPAQVQRDLKHSCKPFLQPQKDVITVSLTTLPKVATKKNGKVDRLSCGYQVSYVCVTHMKDPCDQAEAASLALTEAYTHVSQTKDEDLQAYAAAIQRADAHKAEVCHLNPDVKTELHLPAGNGDAVRD